MSPTRLLARFLHSTIGPPSLLLVAALVGLVWVNLDTTGYENLWEHTFTLGLGATDVTEDLQGWVNDGLMTLFFFGVGLEVKRELTVGELQDPRRAALPAIAALGGMFVPAVIYTVVNVAADGDTSGWAIPVATDIAFTLGVLGLLGRRVPAHLRLFVLTLAIVDDVGGVVIIAVAFSEELQPGYLLASAIVVAAILAARRLGAASPWWYVPLGVALWYTVKEAGVEPTIAGVVLGLLTPAQPVAGRQVLEDLEERLYPYTALLVLPLFAVANTGVRIDRGVIDEAVRSPVAIGVVAGLVAGKTLGIWLATTLAVWSGVGTLHDSVDRRLVLPAAMLAGIGFTVALFVAELTFSEPDVLDRAKLGILVGSLLAGVAGSLYYRRTHARIAGAEPAQDTAPTGS